MADTEGVYVKRFNALQLVHKAKNGVRDARFDAALNASQKASLEDQYIQLDKLENVLILTALDELIDALEGASQNLETIAKKIRVEIKKLQAIADTVNEAAQGVKLLVDSLIGLGVHL